MFLKASSLGSSIIQNLLETSWGIWQIERGWRGRRWRRVAGPESIALIDELWAVLPRRTIFSPGSPFRCGQPLLVPYFHEVPRMLRGQTIPNLLSVRGGRFPISTSVSIAREEANACPVPAASCVECTECWTFGEALPPLRFLHSGWDHVRIFVITSWILQHIPNKKDARNAKLGGRMITWANVDMWKNEGIFDLEIEVLLRESTLRGDMTSLRKAEWRGWVWFPRTLF